MKLALNLKSHRDGVNPKFDSEGQRDSMNSIKDICVIPSEEPAGAVS